MKSLIYKARRFTYSIQVRWKIRKTTKHIRKIAFDYNMAMYDTRQGIKTFSEELQKAIKSINQGRRESP